MGQSVKVCTDCRNRIGTGAFARCGAHITSVEVNLVTGEKSGGDFFHAETARMFGSLCGANGRSWEAKPKKTKGPSLLQRVRLWLSK